MDQVLAEMKILDVIIIGETAEQIDFRFDQEIMASFHAAQVLEYLLASRVLGFVPGLSVKFFGVFFRCERGFEEVEDRAAVI